MFALGRGEHRKIWLGETKLRNWSSRSSNMIPDQQHGMNGELLDMPLLRPPQTTSIQECFLISLLGECDPHLRLICTLTALIRGLCNKVSLENPSLFFLQQRDDTSSPDTEPFRSWEVQALKKSFTWDGGIPRPPPSCCSFTPEPGLWLDKFQLLFIACPWGYSQSTKQCHSVEKIFSLGWVILHRYVAVIIYTARGFLVPGCLLHTHQCIFFSFRSGIYRPISLEWNSWAFMECQASLRVTKRASRMGVNSSQRDW